MRIGAERIDVDYIWPQTLQLPSRPPKVIYLDLNHWVALAKAMAGHQDGAAYAEVLATCFKAVDEGVAVFPISDSIYVEVSKVRQHRQRRDLRQVIERVSRFMVVTSRSVVSIHEIEAVLDRIVGPNPNPINTMDYLDWGVARAFGKAGGFKVGSIEGEDLTAHVRSLHPDGPDAFDLVLATAELELNRKVLEGPTTEEEPQLRKYGWDPLGAFPISERRARTNLPSGTRDYPEFEDPLWTLLDEQSAHGNSGAQAAWSKNDSSDQRRKRRARTLILQPICCSMPSKGVVRPLSSFRTIQI